MRKIALAIFACLAISSCARGVDRPLGKCSETAERRPVAPTRWPGGIKQLEAAPKPSAEAKPDSQLAPAQPPAQSVTVRAVPPVLFPRPAGGSTTLPSPAPSSIEINPTVPALQRSAAEPPHPTEVPCNG